MKECNPCQRSRPNPPATYLHPWERPANPWERIHVDYASVEGQNVLILVDAHSKWIEAIPTSSMTAGMTVPTMRGVFATHGVPKVVASDNGPSFTGMNSPNFWKQTEYSTSCQRHIIPRRMDWLNEPCRQLNKV